MFSINQEYLKLSEYYLFAEISKKVQEFQVKYPQSKIIRLGIGDVTLPLPKAVVGALHKAVDEMSDSTTFKGYGPEQGYEFLRKTIVENDYAARGIDISADEVFISDGAKSDLGNITDILDRSNRIALTDPVYPVYVDSNVMAGRAGDFKDNKWSNIIYLPCTEDNNFIPEFPKERPDVLYLCLPNNPTGTVWSADVLQKWVDYALDNKILILFDSAYEAYIQEENVPHSIYEMKGAKQTAIEFRSFSKTAGFTGLRCGYTIVPRELKAGGVSLNHLWNRRQSTKFNGTPYIVQRAAEAVYSPEGKEEVKKMIAYYMGNAKIISEGLNACGFKVFGGKNAPYIWLRTSDNMSSWEFFDYMMNTYNIVGTPGVGFGPSGEGYFRLTSFGSKENTIEAMNRLVV
ncbi:MAG: LL-diaminopimelate aminotransferase [Culturomica sp.]|jgi:LL-diaminopimelate aminotransferase|nr:LL-diaminopimelate aminotransferase [Culturomica sp.]